MTSTRHGIVVGVTGAGENTSALRWAADQASATHTGVTLVHVVRQVMPPPPPSVLLTAEPLLEAARDRVRDVAAEYRTLTGGECETIAETGHPGRVLSDLSRDADLVVLAHRKLSPLRRVMTWSTTVSAATHAECPVVAVPSTWPRPDDDPAHDWVTVGVHEGGSPLTVLQTAFETAAARGLRVRVVHAWRTEAQYDDIILQASPKWDAMVEKRLTAEVEPLADKYPDVDVEVEVRHEWPADALADLASQSQLLVVGRHGQRPSLPQRIGSIARTAISGTDCPVMVVPV